MQVQASTFIYSEIRTNLSYRHTLRAHALALVQYGYGCSIHEHVSRNLTKIG